MIFASDTWAGAHDRIVGALAEAAKSGGPAYGSDQLTRRVEARFAEPVRAVTPGQAVVFYQGDEVVGGGWIAAALDSGERSAAAEARA